MQPGYSKRFHQAVQFHMESGSLVNSRLLATTFSSADFGSHMLLALQVKYPTTSIRDRFYL